MLKVLLFANITTFRWDNFELLRNHRWESTHFFKIIIKFSYLFLIFLQSTCGVTLPENWISETNRLQRDRKSQFLVSSLLVQIFWNFLTSHNHNNKYYSWRYIDIFIHIHGNLKRKKLVMHDIHKEYLSKHVDQSRPRNMVRYLEKTWCANNSKDNYGLELLFGWTFDQKWP